VEDEKCFKKNGHHPISAGLAVPKRRSMAKKLDQAGWPRTTYFEFGVARLKELCGPNGLGDRVDEIISLFRYLTEPWGNRPLAERTGRWISDVADDNTPYEFSLVYGGPSPEIRILVEAQGDGESAKSQWDAGQALSRRLARDFKVTLDRQQAVESIFVPESDAQMGMWHAACLFPDRAPEFKVYFGAQAQGRWRARALVEEALSRLGFRRAWPAVMHAGSRGLEIDELKYMALDLSQSKSARVKLYWRHHRANTPEMARILGDSTMTEDELREFGRTMAGSDGPYTGRPLFSCTSLTDPESDRPASRTYAIPIDGYVRNDAEAYGRISGYLASHGMPVDRYRESIEKFARRPLDETSGLQSYVTVQRRAGNHRVTVYLSPEAHEIAAVRAPGTSVTTSLVDEVLPAEEIVRRYEHDIVLGDHPFFRRLWREPVNMGHLWLLVANYWHAIVHDFPARLARVIARIDDDRLRSISVKQLNDELGEGDYTRAHKPMFRRLLAALEPYRMVGDDDVLLAPGRRFSRALDQHVFHDDWYHAVGALMMVEIYGKQADLCTGKAFRRQNVLDADALQWLRLHETLEVDHADDSLRVAQALPRPNEGAEAKERLRAVWRGAEGIAEASHVWFQDFYQACYCA
jgi:DMATS type aromatic prenyltransferase